MGRAPNADSLVGNYVNRSSWISKTIILVATQIHLVVPPRNGQCLCQLSRTRTKLTTIDDAPPLPHQRDSASWLERTDENKTVFPSFHQDIQHPVNAVIEINVGRPSMISLDERARTWAHKAMASFIADRVVRFRLDYYPGARIPIQLAPNEITGTAQRTALKKISPQHFAPLHPGCQLVHFSGL
jgi:hypothetical protein